MAATPYQLPERIVAGDTLRWTVQLADYPASAGWTLKYRAFNATTSFVIASAAAGDAHAVDVPAATSADFEPGAYTVAVFVEGSGEHAGERYTLGTLQTRVEPDAASVVADGRSPARQILEALRALYRDHVTSKRALTDSYAIGGRQFKFVSAADLLQQIAYWEREAVREDAAAGLLKRRRVLVRFAR